MEPGPRGPRNPDAPGHGEGGRRLRQPPDSPARARREDRGRDARRRPRLAILPAAGWAVLGAATPRAARIRSEAHATTRGLDRRVAELGSRARSPDRQRTAPADGAGVRRP